MNKLYVVALLFFLISCKPNPTHPYKDTLKDYEEFVRIVERQVLSGHTSKWEEIYHIQTLLKRDIQTDLKDTDSSELVKVKQLDKRLNQIHKKWRKQGESMSLIEFDTVNRYQWDSTRNTDVVMRTDD